jgi:hypothetical protein
MALILRKTDIKGIYHTQKTGIIKYIIRQKQAKTGMTSRNSDIMGKITGYAYDVISNSPSD